MAMTTTIITDGVKLVQLDRSYLAVPITPHTLNEPIADDVQYKITIAKQKNKRSIQANAYCWSLCEQIAQQLSKDGQYTSKEDVYKKAVKDGGKFDYIVVVEEAKETFINSWTSRGIGWLVDELGACEEIPGSVILLLYYGTSVYNTEEMNRIIQCLNNELELL